ncbi:MAG: PAS domain-containing protein [Povalibacter sp.]
MNGWQKMRRSVRGKLMGIVLLSTAIALLVAGLAMLAHDLTVYRQSWAADLASEAGILALSTAPALAFDDRATAERNLRALQARDNVQAAAVYTPNGRPYATYTRTGEIAPPYELPASLIGTQIAGERVEVAQRIVQNGEWLGTIYLRAKYDVTSRVHAYVGIFALVTVVSMVAALLLSAALQRVVTVPLDEVADVARETVQRRDYSLRVKKSTDDEIGIVVDAFNNMLDEVQSQTRALEQSNANLRAEINVRQLAEAALARANTRLESTMGAAEIGSWVWDIPRDEVIADANLAALYGLRSEIELHGAPGVLLRQVHVEDRSRVEAEVQAALQSGALATEFRIVQPDGAIRWVIARGKTQFDADGEAMLFAGLVIDITPQRMAQQRLRESEQLYRAIGESIDHGVWVCDAQGRNTYVSDSFLKLTGMTQQECSDFGWGRLVHPDEVDAMLHDWRECVRTGASWYREHRIRGIDGLYHPVLAQGVPIRSESGEISGWAGINLDISRMKRTEDALREADRRKDEFLATLAHELRNPLAPILNATRVLDAPNASDQQRQWGRSVIARQVQHMALLLDDLLDVSRITRGRLQLKIITVDLAKLISSAVETARPLVDAKAHSLSVVLPPDPIEVRVDPLRLSQALANLLTNAAKYTDPGGRITLAVASGTETLDVSVQDNGIGLSETTRIFEMFSQVETALERSQGGLGIGLALVKGLVAMHGGTVEAASPGLGKGSTFTLHLPKSVVVTRESPLPTELPDVQATRTQLQSRCTVLVADDNRDAADSLALVLKVAGYEVYLAHSGTEALTTAERERPEVMILDIGMPDMNGYEVAQRIRETPWGREALLLAVTGWGQSEDKERSRRAGFDEHLTKPVDLERLENKLEAFVARLTRAGWNSSAASRDETIC